MINDSVAIDTTLWIREQKDKCTKAKFHDVYYEEMKPVLITLRSLARLSYEVNQNGEMVLKFKSKWTVYTVLVYSIQSYLTYENTTVIFERLMDSGGKIENLLFTTTSLTFMAFQFFVPAVFWKEWPQVVRYVNHWRQFQEKCSAHIDTPIAAGLKIPILMTVIFLLPSVLVSSYFVSTILYTSSPFNMLAYIVVFMHSNLYLILWVFSCIKLARASCQMKKELMRVLEVETCRRADKLWRLRCLWLTLSDLAQQLGSVLAPSMLFISVVISYCFVASSYALLSSFLSPGRFHVVAFSTVLTYSFSYLFIMIEAAHRTTEKLGHSFFTEMLRMETTNLDQKSAYEVNLFLQSISMNQPIIKLGGFITINRTTFVSMLASTVTYLIVLVQFKTSEAT